MGLFVVLRTVSLKDFDGKNILLHYFMLKLIEMMAVAYFFYNILMTAMSQRLSCVLHNQALTLARMQPKYLHVDPNECVKLQIV